MENPHLNALIHFAQECSPVACYGAARYGVDTKRFLEANGIIVKCFLVSDSTDGTGSVVDGIPVYSIKEIPTDTDFDGVILSLSEKFQTIVSDNLHCFCRPELKIYTPTMDEFSLIHKWLFDIHKANILHPKAITCTVDEKKCYDDVIQKYIARYTKILVRNADFRYIGSIGAVWPYFCYHRNHENMDTFNLFYPVTIDEQLKGPNEELLFRLDYPGMAIVHRKNLKFWQYFIRKYPGMFIFDEAFSPAGWTSDLDEFLHKIDTNKTYLYMNKSDEIYGKKAMAALGIDKNYVCMSSRDSSYKIEKNEYQATAAIEGKYRNFDIETLRQATEFLGKKGMQSVRMGNTVASKFTGPNIIDYANLRYEAFLDVYLVKHCRFFVGALSGILALPILMAKPMVIINASMLTGYADAMPYFSRTKDLAILKKMWDTRKRRFLTIREILNLEVNISSDNTMLQERLFYTYNKQGIEPVENTADEIVAVVREMEQRLSGEIQYSEQEIDVQKQYDELIASYDFKDNKLCAWRLGTDFLCKNKWLLK